METAPVAPATLRAPATSRAPSPIANGDLVKVRGDTYTSARYEVLKTKGDKAYIYHSRTGEGAWVKLGELIRAEQSKEQYLAEVRRALAGDSAC